MEIKDPVELSEDVFWVGGWIPEDRFQCHVYLLRQGKDSVLFDPGSLITYPQTIEKIKKLIDPKDVKYFVCHHQDPDVTACISAYEKEFPRKDRFVVTHWRTQTLLKHFGWQSKFYLVDENRWRLELPTGRTLKFIFTPYAHFAGSICTYDSSTKILFSSDIFGALTSKNKLFAEDESYFEDIKLFHEHYMPSKEALIHALQKIKALELNLIAPQHGYIIPKKLIPLFIDKLCNIDCGLFLLSSEARDLFLLSKVNHFFQTLIAVLTQNTSFENTLKKIYQLLSSIIPAEDLYLIALREKECILYDLSSKEIKYYLSDPQILKWAKKIKYSLKHKPYKVAKTLIPEVLKKNNNQKSEFYIFPLRIENEVIGFLILRFPSRAFKISLTDQLLLERLSNVLAWFLEKEIRFLNLEKEKREFYNLAVKDSLTGAYNRFFLKIRLEELEKEIHRYKIPLSIILIDLDYFKEVNDTYGHLVGDEVLKQVVKVLSENLRDTDTIIRYGGEEFLILLPHTSITKACKIAERLRDIIEKTTFEVYGHRVKITISAGVVSTKSQGGKVKNLESLIKKADSLLYFAKNKGRNQVICEG